jgi:hypothetical protein
MNILQTTTKPLQITYQENIIPQMSTYTNENEATPKRSEGDLNGSEVAPKRRGKGEHSRAKRPRSAVTSGRQMFISGNPNSAWSRRFHDLLSAHVSDITAGQGVGVLSAAQLTSIRQATCIEAELERLQAARSRGEEINVEAFARTANNLRRLWESLGGLERRPKDVTLTLGEQHQQEQAKLRAAARAEREREQQTIEAAT